METVKGLKSDFVQESPSQKTEMMVTISKKKICWASTAIHTILSSIECHQAFMECLNGMHRWNITRQCHMSSMECHQECHQATTKVGIEYLTEYLHTGVS